MSCLKRKSENSFLVTSEDEDDDYSCVEPLEDECSEDGELSKKGIRTISPQIDHRSSSLTSEKVSTVFKGFTPGTFKLPKPKTARSALKTPCSRGKSARASSGLFSPFPSSALKTGSVRMSSCNTPCVEASSIFIALIEGRGSAKGELGIASFDLKNPALVLYQFTDSQTYTSLITKLNLINPNEVIMANTVCEQETLSKLFKIVSDKCQLKVSSVSRKYFNDQKGFEYIRRLCSEDYATVEFQVKFKYYCLAASYALLKYLEFTQNAVFVPASLKVVFKGSDHTVSIDYSTAKNLELLKSLSTVPSAGTMKSGGASLYSCLNNTKTYMGARLLRSNILQPLCCLDTINARLDMVAELLANETLYHELRNATTLFHDVDRILSHMVCVPNLHNARSAETSLLVVVSLKDTLEAVAVLRNALQPAHSDLFRTYHALLQDKRFEVMLEQVLQVTEESTHYSKGAFTMKIQKGFAIKSEANGLLAISRRTYSEGIEDITQLVSQLSQRYNLPLRSNYSVSRGFYLLLPVAERSLEELPKEFIKPVKQKNSFLFTTYELRFLNEKINISLGEMYNLSANIARDLIDRIRPLMSCLYKLSECVALIDMVSCFAFNCINSPSSHVRPEFTDTLAIKNGHHPILQNTTQTTSNHTFASEEHNFVVISGANMSGKSTYLRQMALLQIMAQMGSYVPAETASFRMSDHIFSRIGSDLDVGLGLSTFMAEMREVNYIIQNANDTSLVIIDELGKSTCEDEGVSICVAIIEFLLGTKAFCFFATHYRHIMMLEDVYARVENYHFSHLDEGSEEEQLAHSLVKGKIPEHHYGIQLAKISTLPKEIIFNAEVFCRRIEADPKA